MFQVNSQGAAMGNMRQFLESRRINQSMVDAALQVFKDFDVKVPRSYNTSIHLCMALYNAFVTNVAFKHERVMGSVQSATLFYMRNNEGIWPPSSHDNAMVKWYIAQSKRAQENVLRGLAARKFVEYNENEKLWTITEKGIAYCDATQVTMPNGVVMMNGEPTANIMNAEKAAEAREARKQAAIAAKQADAWRKEANKERAERGLPPRRKPYQRKRKLTSKTAARRNDPNFNPTDFQ